MMHVVGLSGGKDSCQRRNAAKGRYAVYVLSKR